MRNTNLILKKLFIFGFSISLRNTYSQIAEHSLGNADLN
jgi:hypothetical protein